MNTQIATESVRARSRRSVRALAVSSLGPLTVLAGAVWGVLQPWRVTLLHPRGQGFWWLLAEPPLLVAAAGLAFALLVAPSLLADLEEEPHSPRPPLPVRGPRGQYGNTAPAGTVPAAAAVAGGGGLRPPGAGDGEGRA